MCLAYILLVVLNEIPYNVLYSVLLNVFNVFFILLRFTFYLFVNFDMIIFTSVLQTQKYV